MPRLDVIGLSSSSSSSSSSSFVAVRFCLIISEIGDWDLMCLIPESLHDSQTTLSYYFHTTDIVICYVHVWFPLGIHPFRTSMNLSELDCGYTTKGASRGSHGVRIS
jgi:hypothetical protein